ncbi:hypothetical protein DM01DRAFT_1338476 [Hesseltinella vesiculosa]|uniref:Myb-like domain-containing protein n=1 Tax=Hesseltinella vesiculosa TaxID=101127 RepID=A0A1X2GA36_9FUNG|nr:hypothetical protein DM01DRAFT_1338476 [Hesseltinella vesiculosa]
MVLTSCDMTPDHHTLTAAHTLMNLYHACDYNHQEEVSSDETLSDSQADTTHDEDLGSGNHSSDKESESTDTQSDEGQPSSVSSEADDSHRGTLRSGGTGRRQYVSVNAMHVSKPRWTDSERQLLVIAMIKEKLLDDMATFPWKAMAKVIPSHSAQDCRRQWQRFMLPKMASLYTMRTTKKHKRKSL